MTDFKKKDKPTKIKLDEWGMPDTANENPKKRIPRKGAWHGKNYKDYYVEINELTKE